MSEPAASFFSSAQKRVIGFALGLGAFMVSIALLTIVVVALGRIIGTFSSVIWPLAAAGIMFVMVSATIWHVVRGEISSAIITLVLLAMSTYVAYMRWRVYPIRPRSAAISV